MQGRVDWSMISRVEQRRVEMIREEKNPLRVEWSRPTGSTCVQKCTQWRKWPIWPKKTLQRFGENLNAPCKVTVAKLTKLANLAKMESQAKNHRAKRTPWRVAVFTKMADLAKMANWALKFDMDLANVQISWQKGALGKWRFWRK